MNLVITALMMLCGLGAAILGTTAGSRRAGLGALSGGFVIAAVFIRPGRLPDAGWTGCVVAFVAALQIFKPDIRLIGPALGGALAAYSSALFQLQGLPLGPALIVNGALPAFSVYMTSRRTAFAPDALRQEALLVLFGLGLAVAMIPEISAGWHSALVLNRDEKNSANQIIANWVLVLSASSVALGGLYSLLRRR